MTPTQIKAEVQQAVDHLRQTARGRRAIAALTQLHEVVVNLDSGNTQAVETVVHHMCTHQLNGTINDILTNYGQN